MTEAVLDIKQWGNSQWNKDLNKRQNGLEGNCEFWVLSFGLKVKPRLKKYNGRINQTVFCV